jgi:uncharacterized protein YbcV (DUF1398 family)
MDRAIHDVLVEASRASDEGNQSFGEIVKQLADAGVERYHQDFVRSERTYYLPDGESEVVHNAAVATTPAAAFSTSGVEAAVRAAQAGAIQYKEFCRQAMEAGCVGYLVSIAGRRVVYYGRTGDLHVEYFPGAR